MEYEIIKFEEGQEDYFCKVGPEGEALEISFLPSEQCDTPAVETRDGIFPIEDGMFIVDDGLKIRILTEEELEDLNDLC